MTAFYYLALMYRNAVKPRRTPQCLVQMAAAVAPRPLVWCAALWRL